ncbi:hypothetical protein ERO13_A09G027250v2 [Gossypium hirsutum]|uniref:Uncharacterized protein n=1 Tax=Gossypium darwinii TaxID=34276 RepID=A0A5D2F5W5_GOSDA|nr:hypothetical protein ERO13_A09G027250v2 [Gossypium hirsutum]TYH01161.1 hypothetical protein ES288_A09G034800v1 [Gossypium darwinii]
MISPLRITNNQTRSRSRSSLVESRIKINCHPRASFHLLMSSINVAQYLKTWLLSSAEV